ncbi:MAG: glutamate racemase [Firmicutes bacterium]|nr:glutamate racemase [Bacillota bacterium]
MDNRAIGVFDSGLGGLTVIREMGNLMPRENAVYFGDTARVPYGSKSKATIIEFSHQIMRFLLRHDVKGVIIACGTASSNALEEMKASYDLPIIGVVEPGARAALRATKNGRIGVLGTAATIRSGAFERLLLKEDPSLEVTSQACPLFVPLVEEGWFSDEVTREVIRRYIKPLKENHVDTVILGCTHYPLLRPLIQKEMGENVTLINVSEAATREMKEFLGEHDMEADHTVGTYDFYASDSIDQFRSFSRQILDIENLTVSKVSIEK